MKIEDESILFFSRVSHSKFSLEDLFLSWVKGVFILGWEWNVKSQVFQNRASSWLDWVASSSRKVTEWIVVLFCPMVLQLTCASTSGMPGMCAASGDLQLQVTREIQSRVPVFLSHYWAFLHSISLTTLTRIPPKYRVINCWNTSKFGME